MLGRLILLLLQIVIGWFATIAIMDYVQLGGDLRLFIFAVVAAIVVFLIGVIASQVLREVGTPSSHTLSWALVFALIVAALWTFGPGLPVLSDVPWHRLRAEYAALAGAILGYTIKKFSERISSLERQRADIEHSLEELRAARARLEVMLAEKQPHARPANDDGHGRLIGFSMNAAARD